MPLQRIVRHLISALTPLVLTLSLSGCASHPTGVMFAIGHTVENAHTIDIVVATNRQHSPKPGELYTGERAHELSLSEIVVSIPPEDHRKPGQIQWPQTKIPDPAKDFATVSAKDIQPEDLGDWMAKMPPQSRGHLLIFVHGYNTPFDGGVYLLAQVVNDAHMNVAPVIFSWPSRGKVLDYDYDRQSVTASRTDLADILETAAAQDSVTDITILAHSMGGWLTMEALRTIALRHGHMPAKIHNVILASPDIDVDVFYTQYSDLGSQPPPITLFVSQDDRALRLSRLLGGNVDRLGAINLNQEPYKSGIEKTNVRVIDITKVRGNDQSNHLKFSENPDIVSLVGQTLLDGQKLNQNASSLREKLGVLIIGGGRLVVGKAEGIAGSKP
jgi:esterase/lipase superfamily enzyme